MLWVIVMDPHELNALVAILVDYFFTSLSKKEFLCLSIFLRELSKSMFSMAAFEEICSDPKK
jgi:hypothetical protein